MLHRSSGKPKTPVLRAGKAIDRILLSLAILRLFHRIAEEGGVTVILATHDASAAEVADVTYDLVDGVLTRREKRAA